MPADGAASIAAMLAARGIVLDTPAVEALQTFAALLLHWNRRINLVGTQHPQVLWQRHLLDCLMLERVPCPPALRNWVDVGAGGGLPAVPLALLHPERHITAVESVAKKATFLTEAKRVLGLANLTVLRADVWKLAQAPAFQPYDGLIARAFADLATLLRLGTHLLRPAGELWAMKGRRWPAEAAAVPPHVAAAYAQPPMVYPYGGAGADLEGAIVAYRHRGASTGA